MRHSLSDGAPAWANGEEPAGGLLDFTVSLPFDQRLARYDLIGSRAHVRGLKRVGLLTADDAATIRSLPSIGSRRSSARASFTSHPGDEDIHTAIERRVTEIAGPAGARLHTGRSRNDQVATALRLWCKDQIGVVGDAICGLQSVLLERAEAAGDVYLPGYTHMQRAQPVLLAHHFLAHGWALARDLDRLLSTRRRLDVSPLGAGALAGSSLPLDPDGVAADLGFNDRFDNSLDAVSDRDFVAELLFDLALLGVHLSRIGEEIVLWSTAEFGFSNWHDAVVDGLVDAAAEEESGYRRAGPGQGWSAHRPCRGDLTTLKGLPLAYNRDLQEDKEPLFDAVDQLLFAVPGCFGRADLDGGVRCVPHAGGRRHARESWRWTWPSISSADGMPFRDAHASRRLRSCVTRSLGMCRWWSWSRRILRWGPRRWRCSSRGSPSPGERLQVGPKPVAEQLSRFRQLLDVDRERLRPPGPAL